MKKLFGLNVFLLAVVLFFISAHTVNAQNNIYRVLSPNGGEVLDWSKTYLIRWNSDYNTKVDIALFKNDAFYKWIALNINHYPTAIYWIPSKTISQSDIGNNVFKIDITFKKDGKDFISDKSDAPFSIILEKQPEKINPENTNINTKGFIVLEEVQNSPKVSCLLPILKQGQKNNAVYLLQIVLYKEGYYPEGLITGFFGLLTQKAVKNFQQSNNLPVTGSIEKASFSKINSLMNKHFSECKLQD